ncbi:alanine racemase [Paenactinomyces guangxiensis]|uniref:alanine racemase n=1 Tax=Paenactinomyces guangxiensis TaxID=1490290 RepID=UPI001A329AD0|nr:alanine racemase [Paenactinomyces guangxiensis]MBH8592146.1 alanine racemase [Paenactinomyces guangxiensis]
MVAEVNLSAIAFNYREVRHMINPQAKIMGVVKGDAYGHGLVQVAKTLAAQGVDQLAVASIQEGVQLRQAGITLPILVLGYTHSAQAKEIVQYDLMQSVFSLDMAQALSEAAHRKTKIHIKIDTGLGRVGFLPNHLSIEWIKKIQGLSGIQIEGIYTHFSSASDEDKGSVSHQYHIFASFIHRLEEENIHIPIRHAANSPSIIQFPETHLNMVRPGILLYGLLPSSKIKADYLQLKEAMTLKSRVIFLKSVDKGVSIGYGRSFITRRKSQIATISVGFAYGYSRSLSNQGYVLIREAYAPIVGMISMHHIMVDVTDIPNITVWDEVVLFGRMGNKRISVNTLSDLAKTINTEILCSIGSKVPRVYTLTEEFVI